MLQRRLPIDHSEPPPAPASEPDRLIATSNDLEAVLTAPVLRAGDTHRLTIALRDAKNHRAVTDLEQYLGAWGHLFVVQEERDEALHAHPDHTDTTPGGPTIAFDVLFPRAGAYHLWTQVRHRHAIVTLPFLVHVQPRG
jgi:hypothetical protein